MKYERQNSTKFVDYLRLLKHYQRRLPDITVRHLCHKIWDTANRYIKVKWIEAGMDGEHTELQVLADAAERSEKAENVLWSNDCQNNGNCNSYQKNGNAHTSSQTKPSDKAKKAETDSKPESSKAKNNGKKKDGQHQKKDKSKENKPKMSKEERNQLRAEGKCFSCKEVGHTLKDCPSKNSAKTSGVYTAAIQFDKITELRKERDQSYIPVTSICQFGSPTLTETPSENPTAGECLLAEILDQITPYSRIVVANEELLRVTSEELDEYEISYKEIAGKGRDTYLECVERRA